jgi:TolB protein
MGSRTTAILITAGLALLTAGCGGGGEPKKAAAATPTPKGTAGSATTALPAGLIAFRRYTDAAHNTGAIFTISTDGSDERQITQPPSDFVDDHPDFSPDGKQIAFERCQEGDGGGDAVVSTFKPCTVWTIPTAGGDPKQITFRCRLDPCDARSPAWAPDGKLVVTLDQGPVKTFGDGFNVLEQSAAEEMDPATHKQRTIYRRDKWEGEVATPAVSANGRTLLYSRRNSTRAKPALTNGLFAVGRDGNGNHQVAPYKLGGGDHPVFTADGKVLFRSHEENEALQSQLYTVGVDGTGLRRITSFPDGTLVLSTSVSPDGRWIVLGTKPDRADGDADVAVIAADGSGDPQLLVSSKDWESAPDWSP